MVGCVAAINLNALCPYGRKIVETLKQINSNADVA